MTTRSTRLLISLLFAGCGSSAHAADDASVDGATPETPPCAITWIDETPIARDRERFADPVITGDHDGFLFVTRTRVPDRCEDAPCVVVERLGATGSASITAYPAITPIEGYAYLFAGTDPSGAAHYAVAAQSEATELTWGSGPTWDEPSRIALDPTRGLGAVAFDVGGVVFLTHAWRSEGTIGEGFPYPIAPEVLRASLDGSLAAQSGLDPTEGELFVEADFALSSDHTWLVTDGFYGGPLRGASDTWTGLLREHTWSGRHATTALRDGSLVLVDDYEGFVRVVRIDREGTPREAATLTPSLLSVSLAVATDGERVLVVHRTPDAAVNVTVLDASLSVLATGVVATGLTLDEHTRVGAAAANDGTLALFLAPFPTHAFDVNEPVELRRFRTTCE